MDNYTKVREDISQALDNAQELGYHARQKCRSRVPIYDIHLRNLVIEWDNGTVGNAIPFDSGIFLKGVDICLNLWQNMTTQIEGTFYSLQTEALEELSIVGEKYCRVDKVPYMC